MKDVPQSTPLVMPVYHGSYTGIDKIDLSKCRDHRDFGRGFYVTKFRRQAETWAKIIGEKYDTKGVVTEFVYRDNTFTQHICKKKTFDDYSEEWLDFVVLNRNADSPTPAHDYDIVEGPVANDKVQIRIKDYLLHKISKADFLEELKWHKETHQICFCTLVGLRALTSLDDTQIWSVTKITEPLLEALMLDRYIDEMQAADLFFTSQTFEQLDDASTKLYLRPWQEIYEMLKREL